MSGILHLAFQTGTWCGCASEYNANSGDLFKVDPQQRLLLECTFEALENAGIPKQSVVGQDVGVFIGGSLSEYETHLSRDSDSMPMYQSTGKLSRLILCCFLSALTSSDS